MRRRFSHCNVTNEHGPAHRNERQPESPGLTIKLLRGQSMGPSAPRDYDSDPLKSMVDQLER